MLKLYAALFLLSSTVFCAAQTSTTPVVENIRFENGMQTAYARIANTSNKDITGFVLSVDAVYADGHTDHWLRLADFVHTMLDHKNLGRSENYGAFHPGNRKEERFDLPPRNGEWPTVTLNIKLTVIAYADATVDVRNDDEDALGHLIAFRKKDALAARMSAEAISEAAADPVTPDPLGMAISKLRALAQAQEQKKQGEEYHSARVLSIISALENMGSLNKSELRNYATQKYDDAAFLSAHATLRRNQ